MSLGTFVVFQLKESSNYVGKQLDMSDAMAELEGRLRKVEDTLQQLLEAGLDKYLKEESCCLHVPEHPEHPKHPDPHAVEVHGSHDSHSVQPPDHPPEPLRSDEEERDVQGSDSQGSKERKTAAWEVKERPSQLLAVAEPKDALKVYHNRASVIERREHGVDETYLETETKEYYTFGESTWDLVMLIGMGSLGPLGALQTIILVIMNVLMQGVFVGIAWFNFLEPDVDAQTIQDAFRWRRSSAHSLNEYDTVSRMSLAERVCGGDKSLHLSGVQMNLFDNIDQYLKPDRAGLETYFAGPVLCMVALICWYMMVGKEVSHALALHRGLIAIPRGENKIEPRENPFTQITHYRLVSITNRRILASYCLLIYRLVAAAVLIYVGTFFLATGTRCFVWVKFFLEFPPFKAVFWMFLGAKWH